MFLTTTKNIRQ